MDLDSAGSRRALTRPHQRRQGCQTLSPPGTSSPIGAAPRPSRPPWGRAHVTPDRALTCMVPRTALHEQMCAIWILECLEQAHVAECVQGRVAGIPEVLHMVPVPGHALHMASNPEGPGLCHTLRLLQPVWESCHTWCKQASRAVWVPDGLKQAPCEVWWF